MFSIGIFDHLNEGHESDDLDEHWQTDVLVNMHMYAKKNEASRSSRCLLAVHNRTFRDYDEKNGRTDVGPTACLDHRSTLSAPYKKTSGGAV